MRFSFIKFRPKLIEVLRAGYTKDDLMKDIVAGITVGVVALPLALAFAIASKVPPVTGLVTAFVGGFVISLLGGSRYQVGGPTGAFVGLVAVIVTKYGMDGLILATFMAGILLLIFGLLRLGTYIKFIPYSVTTGFTAGIGIILISTEVKDFFGFDIAELSTNFIEKCVQYAQAVDTINPLAMLVGVLTVGLTLFVRSKVKKIPAHIFAIVISTLIVAVFSLDIPTIGSEFGTLPNKLPLPSLPKNVEWSMVVELFSYAITIAALAGIESLLSAVIADGMSGDRHDSNTELIGQGVANIMTSLFGGIPATGAIARTVTNIKLGARSPISGIIHAVVLLIMMLGLSQLVELIPMAAIAGILMVISWDMLGIKDLFKFKDAPRNDLIVMVVSLVLTVLVNITVAVQVGVVMSALMFMKGMSDVTTLETVVDSGVGSRALTLSDPDSIDNKEVPPGVGVYEINGPFFFGVADKLISTLEAINNVPEILVLRMRKVPSIDATGMNALENFLYNCRKQGIILILSGIQIHGQTRKVMDRHGFVEQIGRENICKNIDVALERAAYILSERQRIEDEREALEKAERDHQNKVEQEQADALKEESKEKKSRERHSTKAEKLSQSTSQPTEPTEGKVGNEKNNKERIIKGDDF